MAYFAFIHDTIAEPPSIDSILVVCEFSNMFSIDLLGGPPGRNIDFAVDLVSALSPFLSLFIVWI